MATKKEISKKIVEMLSEHKSAMLVTRDKQGGLVSRPMTTQKPKFDGDLWFFVSNDADMIEEIEADPEVNVSYSTKNTFVSVSGKASMVDDDKKKKELWYPELKQWFDGAEPEDPKVKLIKITADTARYWDMSKMGKKSKSGDSKNKKEESPIESEMIKY